jgi:LmbE family N-acetylglucosaminyl deacetylase
MRILGIGAHPDDVEIFFFGTLAAAQASGAEIGWLIATDGSKGGKASPAKLRATRRREAMAAAALLAVMPGFLGRIDGELAGDAEVGRLIEAEILRRKPDLIITHAPNDYHPDHRALSRLVSDAARFRAPVAFADTLMGAGFAPTIFVDVTAHMERKHEAIRCHASQRPDRFVAATETWNRFRALQANAPDSYAEAFRFEPVYPFADVRALLPAAPPVRGL